MQETRVDIKDPQLQQSKIILPKASGPAVCCELNPVNLVGFLILQLKLMEFAFLVNFHEFKQKI